MKRPLSLIMNSTEGSPDPLGDGVVYQFKPSAKHLDDFRIWEVDCVDNGYFNILASYPDDDTMDNIKEMYAGEDWFDSDELDHIMSYGCDVCPVQIWAENNYRLPDQEITLEDGHVMAHDTRTGIERELAKITVSYKGQVRLSFYMFIRGKGGDMNFSSVSRIINFSDSKTPRYITRLWGKLLNEISSVGGTLTDLKIATEDTYVLATA